MSNNYNTPVATEALTKLFDLLTGDLVGDIVGSLSGGEIAIITGALEAVGDTAGVEYWEERLRETSEEDNDGEDWAYYLDAKRGRS